MGRLGVEAGNLYLLLVIPRLPLEDADKPSKEPKLVIIEDT